MGDIIDTVFGDKQPDLPLADVMWAALPKGFMENMKGNCGNHYVMWQSE